MTRRGNPALSCLLITAAAVLTIGLLSCGDGNGDPSPSASATSPAPTGDLDLSPTVGGVEVLRRYVVSTGLEGKKGTLTDPVDCAKVGDAAKGDFCIIENASVYAPGLIIAYVANVEKQDKEIWTVRLRRGDVNWEVTGVKFIGVE